MSPSNATLAENDVIETLFALQQEGKTRFIGMSGILPHLPEHIALGVFDVFQIPYSALQREHEDLITQAAQEGAGTLIRGGAARGAPAEDKNWQADPIGLAAGEGQRRWQSASLDGLIAEAGLTKIEFTLRFTLSHPALTSTIVGTSSLEHLAANLAIAEKGPLPGDVYAEAVKRLAA
jgi:aryl-alcohol dehydrogenase-like predicted oxidoreductase